MSVADFLAEGNLRHSKLGPGRLAQKKADKKEGKYRRIAEELQAVHLPFAVETMGGMGDSAQQLLREVHHCANTHCTWRDADAIGSHLLDCVAVAVQRCTGMALRASVERETRRALGARAAYTQPRHVCEPYPRQRFTVRSGGAEGAAVPRERTCWSGRGCCEYCTT